MLLHSVKSRVEKWFSYEVRFEKTNITGTFEVTEKRVHWLFKPLWGCPPCMVSSWGALLWLVAGWDWDLVTFVVSIVGASFLNALLWKWYSK